MASSCIGCHFQLASNKYFFRRDVLLIYDCHFARTRPRSPSLIFLPHLPTFPRRQSFRQQHPLLPDATYYLSTTAISHGLALDQLCSSSYYIFSPSLDDKAFVDNTLDDNFAAFRTSYKFIPRRLLLAFFLDAFSPIASTFRGDILGIESSRCPCNRSVATLSSWNCFVTRAHLLGLHIIHACSFSIIICLMPPDGQHFLRAHACRASRTLRPTPSSARLRQP